jgi:hypothetical protein
MELQRILDDEVRRICADARPDRTIKVSEAPAHGALRSLECFGRTSVPPNPFARGQFWAKPPLAFDSAIHQYRHTHPDTATTRSALGAHPTTRNDQIGSHTSLAGRTASSGHERSGARPAVASRTLPGHSADRFRRLGHRCERVAKARETITIVAACSGSGWANDE